MNIFLSKVLHVLEDFSEYKMIMKQYSFVYFWYCYYFLLDIEMYAKKIKSVKQVNDRIRKVFGSFSALTVQVVGIYYNAALFYYSNNHSAKELSYQKTYQKIIFPVWLMLCDHRRKAGAKNCLKNNILFTNSNSQMVSFVCSYRLQTAVPVIDLH